MPDGSEYEAGKRRDPVKVADRVIGRELETQPYLSSYLQRAVEAGNMTPDRAKQISKEFANQGLAGNVLLTQLSTAQLSSLGVSYTAPVPTAAPEPVRHDNNAAKPKAPGCTE